MAIGKIYKPPSIRPKAPPLPTEAHHDHFMKDDHWDRIKDIKTPSRSWERRTRRSASATGSTTSGARPWNPFSESVYANSLFLRKEHNKDNCLHTVVSVASEFAEILSYPLLTDGQQFALGQKPLEEWTVSDEQSAAAHRYRVRAIRGQDGRLEEAPALRRGPERLWPRLPPSAERIHRRVDPEGQGLRAARADPEGTAQAGLTGTRRAITLRTARLQTSARGTCST